MASSDEWDFAQVFPVCCTVDLTAEAMDRFLEANLDDDKPGNWHCFMDSLTKSHDTPPQRPITEPSSPSSPFKGKTPLECHQLLKQFQQDRTISPSIDYYHFVIMDERSMEDDTCLLVVCHEEGDPDPRTVRAEFFEAGFTLPALSIGHIDFEEILDTASRSKHGVLGNRVLRMRESYDLADQVGS